jgi:hypothetical protein
MKRTVFKITVFCLILSLFLPTLVGCARETDEEMLVIAEAQLEKTAKVNAICFGEGLTPMTEGGYPVSGYVEATSASRAAFGVQTVAEIKALISEVYTDAASAAIDQAVFHPVQVDGSYASYSRYFDAVDDDEIHLMIKKDYEPLTVGTVSYDNLRLVAHDRTRAAILVDVTVTDGTQTRTDKDILFRLRFEGETWKYDTLTYSSIR